MAFRVKPTENAKQNARDILAWLREQQAGDAGLRWFEGLRKAISSLREFPARCAIAPESKDFPFEVRQLVYGRKPHQYRILFTIEGKTVWVLHVRHGRRHALMH
jgi:plasmid stabilization system protein ParE